MLDLSSSQRRDEIQGFNNGRSLCNIIGSKVVEMAPFQKGDEVVPSAPTSGILFKVGPQ